MFFKYLASKFKNLEYQLEQARIDSTKEEFAKKMFFNSLAFSLALGFVLFVFLDKFELGLLIIVFLPAIFLALLMFFMHYPSAKTLKIAKRIDSEIVSFIRFLILDIKAGRSLFDTLKDVSKNFKQIGIYTDEIVKEVELGSTFADALNKKANEISSESFRIVIWQMVNHLKTGTDIGNALETIVHEVEEKQRIEFKKFGKKLNALSVLYMVIAIILPTIGFTIFASFLMFAGIEVGTSLVIGVWVILTLIQVMFLVSSTSNRPPVDLE